MSMLHVMVIHLYRDENKNGVMVWNLSANYAHMLINHIVHLSAIQLMN